MDSDGTGTARGLAPSTASSHLNRLVTGGLLTEERKGRHRQVRLADPSVADLIEALAARAPQRLTPVHSLVAARRHRAVASARICYDHLGGSLSVAITDAMTEQGFLDWDFGPAPTPSGVPPGSRTQASPRKRRHTYARVWTGRSGTRTWRALSPRP
ncbi:hypothetical protein SUDANB178_07356 [Streptomyces sp. enrichment culture]